MKLISKLFGPRKSNPPVTAGPRPVRTTTAQKPFRIESPTIGFLNLRGIPGEDLVKVDRLALEPLFTQVRVSEDAVPQCSVIFIYCDLDPNGRIVGRGQSLRDIIQTSRAYVAVVASENKPNHYMKCLGPRAAWAANVVLTIERKGEKLAVFFAEVFRRMYEGKSMLTAWVELAPQNPAHDDLNAPATIMAAEAGHLVFKRA